MLGYGLGSGWGLLLCRPWYSGSGAFLVWAGVSQGLPGVSRSMCGMSWLGYLRHSTHVRKPRFSILGARNSVLTGYGVRG